jgi:hypothetical protein
MARSPPGFTRVSYETPGIRARETNRNGAEKGNGKFSPENYQFVAGSVGYRRQGFGTFYVGWLTFRQPPFILVADEKRKTTAD